MSEVSVSMSAAGGSVPPVALPEAPAEGHGAWTELLLR